MGTSDISADQVLLVTGGYDHSIRFWQAHSAVCYRTLQHTDSQVNAMEVVPDRQTLAAAGFQHIRLYDLNSNNPNPVINCEGISKNVTAVGFHEEGKWMYSGGEDGSCRIWDLRSRNMQCQRICQISSPVNTAFLHPNQGEIVLGDQNGTIHFWDLRADRSTELLTEKGISIHSVVVDPEGVYLAAVNNKGMCYIWTLSGPAANEGPKAHGKKVFKVHNKYALRCKFSPDSTLLMTTSADCTARIWKTADFSQMSELTTESQRWVWDCAFSTDSQYVITASSDGAARLWSVDGGPPKREYHGHQKPIIALAFRDGESIE